MFRFIHTSDWHLGKPFGQFEDDVRGRLREARHSIIDRIASKAQQGSATLIVVAGDIWDNDTPSAVVLQQSLDAMKRYGQVTWALLPGNHDLAREGGLWERIASRRPENVRLLLDEVPLEVEPGVYLLAAPCLFKDTGRDSTEWMNGATTPHGGIRIGVAHGGIHEFGVDRPHSAVIDANRASRAKLHYLALGDWHGTVQINERCWYSGTPEPDRFRKNDSGNCLLVEIPGAGERPSVERQPVGQFTWINREIDLLPEMQPAEFLGQCVPKDLDPRNILLTIQLTGRGTLADREYWKQAFCELRPSLAFLAYDETGLETVYEADDLDRINHAGALREAAEALLSDASDTAIGNQEREIARDALNLLYSWCVEAEKRK